MIIASESFRKDFPAEPEVFEVAKGRILGVRFSGSGEKDVYVTSVHIDPALPGPQQKHRLDWILRAVPPPEEAYTFVAGDFNITGTGEGRFNLRTSEVTYSSESLARHLDKCFEGFTEVCTNSHTRRQVEGDMVTNLSRIDRCFLNLDPGNIQQLSASLVVDGDIRRRDLLSDHLPIRLALREPATNRGGEGGPRWIADHPDYPEAIEAELRYTGFSESGNSFDDLARYKRVVVGAARALKMATRLQEKKAPGHRLFWLQRAYAAVAKGDSQRLVDALEAVPEFSDLFSVEYLRVISLPNYRMVVANLRREDLDDQLKDIDGMDLDKEQKSSKKAHVHLKLAAWAKRGRRYTSINIVKDGKVLEDKNDAFAEVANHWGPVFNARSVDDDMNPMLVPHRKFDLGDIEPIGLDEFEELVRKRRTSAPGPDGLPYTVWSASLACGIAVLYRCYLDVISGVSPPSWYNESLLVFIPKGDGDPLRNDVEAAPKDLRPLNLSNSDHKLVAQALNCALAEIAQRVCHQNQRGFIKGRNISDNVVQLEGATQVHLLRDDRCPGQLLFDVQAAFASVLWKYVWRTLERPAGSFMD